MIALHSLLPLKHCHPHTRLYHCCTIMDPCQNPLKDYHFVYQIPMHLFLAPCFLLYPLEQPHHHLPFIPVFQQAHSPLYLILLWFTPLHPFLLVLFHLYTLYHPCHHHCPLLIPQHLISFQWISTYSLWLLMLYQNDYILSILCVVSYYTPYTNS